MGGYRNKRTGTRYHHAGCQTEKTPTNWSGIEKFHRETQTAKVVTRSQQTTREAGTQMSRNDIYVDDRDDKYLTPKPYFDSNQWFNQRLRYTIVIQRFVRGWQARKITQCIREERACKERENRELEEAKKREAELHHKREIERRMHPRTKEDFDIL